MCIADQLKFLQSVLGPWAVQNGGQAFVASDPSIMWEMAYSSSGQLRVIVCYMGEENRAEFQMGAILRRVDRSFEVLITRGRGFSYPRGNTLTDTVGNAVPMFTLVEEGRDLIRSILNLSVERPLDFRAVKHHAMEGLIMDAYSIEFSVADDLPLITDQPLNTVAIPQ